MSPVCRILLVSNVSLVNFYPPSFSFPSIFIFTVHQWSVCAIAENLLPVEWRLLVEEHIANVGKVVEIVGGESVIKGLPRLICI